MMLRIIIRLNDAYSNIILNAYNVLKGVKNTSEDKMFTYDHFPVIIMY